MTAQEFAELLASGVKLALDQYNVKLPSHLFIPKDAESIDPRNLKIVPANQITELEILRVEAKSGQYINWTNYAIYNEGRTEADIEFFPRINGKRVLELHGNPQAGGTNFKLSLSTGLDLSNDSLIQCYERLRPNDVLTWHVINRSGVAVRMGVRMVGYLSNQFIK